MVKAQNMKNFTGIYLFQQVVHLAFLETESARSSNRTVLLRFNCIRSAYDVCKGYPACTPMSY